jgi:hypothetical protein
MEEEWKWGELVDPEDWASSLISGYQRDTEMPECLVTREAILEVIGDVKSGPEPEEWKNLVIKELEEDLERAPYKLGE